jgi:hypothetical protein
MIQVVEKNQIKRDGIKIGYIDGTHIFDHNGKKLAYFSIDEVLDENGKRIAHVVGEYVYFPKSNTKVRIEDNNKLVAGVVSDACRAAIRLVLG